MAASPAALAGPPRLLTRHDPATHRTADGELIDVSVVICACADERLDDLVLALESIQAQSLAPLETVVAVDHNPALVRYIGERWPEVVVAHNDTQRGVSSTRNAGVAVARGEVIAFLDDDAVAAPDWLERLVCVYEDASVMAVGGGIEPLWQPGRPAWFPAEFDWVVGCAYLGLPERPAAVRNVIGTNMSFRREVLDGIGGFDPDIGRVGRVPIGCDETELCVRAHRRWPERRIVHDPRVRVSHRVPAHRRRLRYFLSRCYGEGRSKALISERLGQRDALAVELRYATRTLPAGVLRGLRDAALGDGAGLGRAAAILAGLTVTSIGFVTTRLATVPGRLALHH